MKKTFKLFTLITLLGSVFNLKGQEKIDLLGNSYKNEMYPVMTLRSNGNILVASQLTDGGTDTNILVVEYNLSTSTIIRKMEFGESGIDEIPIDIIEESDGRILILANRRGNSLATFASVRRTNGYVFRIQNSSTNSFSFVEGRDLIPNSTPSISTDLTQILNDGSVFPVNNDIRCTRRYYCCRKLHFL